MSRGRPHCIRAPQLSPSQQQQLSRIVTDTRNPLKTRQRAQLLLWLNACGSVSECARVHGVQRNRCYRLIEDFAARGLECIKEKARSGRPVNYTEEDKSFIRQTACQRPFNVPSGLDSMQWSLDTLCSYLKTQGPRQGMPHLKNLTPQTLFRILSKSELTMHISLVPEPEVKARSHCHAAEPALKMITPPPESKLHESASTGSLNETHSAAASLSKDDKHQEQVCNRAVDQTAVTPDRNGHIIWSDRSPKLNGSTLPQGTYAKSPPSNHSRQQTSPPSINEIDRAAASSETRTTLCLYKRLEFLLTSSFDYRKQESQVVIDYNDQNNQELKASGAGKNQPSHILVRNAIMSLMVGIDLTSGNIVAHPCLEHTTETFEQFLGKLSSSYEHTCINLIIDHHHIHDSNKVRQALKTLPNKIVFHFNPQETFFLNCIENIFSKLMRLNLSGLNAGNYEELTAKIASFITTLNACHTVNRWSQNPADISRLLG